MSNQANVVQQDYMLIASDLYYQGAPLASVRDRLLKLGFSDPPLAVLQTADQLSSSPDKVKQQEADQLHQFAEALASGVDRNAPPPVIARAAPTSPAAPTDVSIPTGTAQAAVPPVATPAPIPTDIPTAVAASAPAVTTASNPSASARPASTPAGGIKTGVIVSSDQKPVFLRHDPSTKAKAIASMPVGATVEIKSTVVGTAVNPGENHWYKVSYSGTDGYVYSQFVQVGG
jgi:hypothetical protein